MNEYSLANSFLSSYTGVPPQMFAMGPLNLNKDEVLTKTEKNKNKINIFDNPTSIFNKEKGQGYFNLPGTEFNTTGIIKDIMEGSKKDKKQEKDEEYGRMTKYATDVIDKVDTVAQKARERDFLREGIRSLANAPLLGAEYAMRAAEGINNVTIANMGAMAAQNRLFDSNPLKQKIAGKYFG